MVQIFLVAVITIQFLLCESKFIKTILGNEALRSNAYEMLSGHRVAVLTNPTGVFANDMIHIVDDMHEKSSISGARFDFVLVLGPEHGFRGEKQAETGDIPYYVDAATGLPVLSAYSLSVSQLRDSLQAYNITAIVVDIQDVGVRLYTFIWTMYNVMDAFTQIIKNSESNYEFFVCDRPNPNGGNFVDGPMLNSSFASGYGRAPIPFIHGMTIGELALLFNDHISSPISNLQIVKMRNWDRTMSYYDTRLPWIPPSPNLPTIFSAVTYSATVFIEATTISEGRGTCTPFTLIGAPFINGLQLAASLNERFKCTAPMSSACFRGAYFQPTFQKYNGTIVQGVQYLEDAPYRAADNIENHSNSVILKTFESATILLTTLKAMSYPESNFQWDGSWFGHPGTELIDEYAGTDQYRLMIDDGKSVEAILQYFKRDADAFKVTRLQYLLY